MMGRPMRVVSCYSASLRQKPFFRRVLVLSLMCFILRRAILVVEPSRIRAGLAKNTKASSPTPRATSPRVGWQKGLSIFPPNITQPVIQPPSDSLALGHANASLIEEASPKSAESIQDQMKKASILIRAYQHYVPPWWPVQLPRPPPGWLPWPPPPPPIQVMRWLYPHIYTRKEQHTEPVKGRQGRRAGNKKKRNDFAANFAPGGIPSSLQILAPPPETKISPDKATAESNSRALACTTMSMSEHDPGPADDPQAVPPDQAPPIPPPLPQGDQDGGSGGGDGGGGSGGGGGGELRESQVDLHDTNTTRGEAEAAAAAAAAAAPLRPRDASDGHLSPPPRKKLRVAACDGAEEADDAACASSATMAPVMAAAGDGEGDDVDALDDDEAVQDEDQLFPAATKRAKR